MHGSEVRPEAIAFLREKGQNARLQIERQYVARQPLAQARKVVSRRKLEAKESPDDLAVPLRLAAIEVVM